MNTPTDFETEKGKIAARAQTAQAPLKPINRDPLNQTIARRASATGKAIGTIRGAQTRRDEIESKIPALTADLAEAEAEQAKWEGISIVQLTRLNMTNEEALEKANAASSKVQALRDRLAKLEQDESQLEATLNAEVTKLEGLVDALLNDTLIASEAEFFATLASMLDPRSVDIFAYRDLFGKTVAARILETRRYEKRSAKGGPDLLRLADEIVAQPIPPLIQLAAELPDVRSDMLVSTIVQY